MIDKINTLLVGKEGISMKDDAFDMARELIGSENLDNHPDFTYLTLNTNAKSIGVDDVLPLLQKGYIKPVLSKTNVAIIDHMDCMTVQAQNKLLLTMEGSPYLTIIGICYKDNLLATVKSRMKIVEYKPMSNKVFRECLPGELDSTTMELLYQATGGYSSCIPYLQDKTTYLNNVYSACMNNAKELFSILHLVKEKDPLCIINDRRLLLATLRVMAYAFVKKIYASYTQDNAMIGRYIDIAYELLDATHKCLIPQYAQANLFNIVMLVVEKGE